MADLTVSGILGMDALALFGCSLDFPTGNLWDGDRCALLYNDLRKDYHPVMTVDPVTVPPRTEVTVQLGIIMNGCPDVGELVPVTDYPLPMARAVTRAINGRVWASFLNPTDDACDMPRGVIVGSLEEIVGAVELPPGQPHEEKLYKRTTNLAGVELCNPSTQATNEIDELLYRQADTETLAAVTNSLQQFYRSTCSHRWTTSRVLSRKTS